MLYCCVLPAAHVRYCTLFFHPTYIGVILYAYLDNSYFPGGLISVQPNSVGKTGSGRVQFARRPLSQQVVSLTKVGKDGRPVEVAYSHGRQESRSYHTSNGTYTQ